MQSAAHLHVRVPTSARMASKATHTAHVAAGAAATTLSRRNNARVGSDKPAYV